MTLFREEVLTRKRENLHGNINLALPISWQLITLALAAIPTLTAVFLFSANYSRSVTADGSLLPAGGILQVIPPKVGRIEDIAVEEGQLVRKGQFLARVVADRTNAAGVSTQSEVLSAIERQRRELKLQQALTRTAATSEREQFGLQISGLKEEAASLGAQISVQEKLVDIAQHDLDRANRIADRGFISQRDIDVRQETLLSRQQQLSVLRQAKAAKQSAAEQSTRAQRQAIDKASNSAAALSASQAQVERELATIRGEQSYWLVAPTEGRVAGISIHVGDTVDAQGSAMMIVTLKDKLVARLYIPSKAAGFVRAGQEVRLALDAFPYERFGTVEGSISVVSSAPVVRPIGGGETNSFYVATVMVNDPAIYAYGYRRKLLPGMTLTARIILEHRSLFQWLFDPLIAAARQ